MTRHIVTVDYRGTTGAIFQQIVPIDGADDPNVASDQAIAVVKATRSVREIKSVRVVAAPPTFMRRGGTARGAYRRRP